MNKIEKIFPSYFTDNAVQQIMECGKEESIFVYRVAKYGKNDKSGFLNYYDEVLQGYKVVRGSLDRALERYRNNIDSLSVSCYYKKEDIEDYFNYTLKDIYPKRILLKGVTNPKYGLTQRTHERKEKEDSHTDWWLYENAEPWLIFEREN